MLGLLFIAVGYFFVLLLLNAFFRTQVETIGTAFLIILWLAANVLDYHSTQCCMSTEGTTEGNPLCRKFMDIFGEKRGLLLFKLIFTVIATLILIFAPPTTVASWAIVILLVAGRNYYLYFKNRKSEKYPPDS